MNDSERRQLEHLILWVKDQTANPYEVKHLWKLYYAVNGKKFSVEKWIHNLGVQKILAIIGFGTIVYVVVYIFTHLPSITN